MGWDGMLLQRDCDSCGRPLNENGKRPAELYAGTSTGLCYGCERKKPFVVRRFRDGALRISYPPHSPAWRRDRQEYIAYPDCEACDGKGKTIIYRSFGRGGSYPAYCGKCLNRYWEEPLRKRAGASQKKLLNRMQRKYEDELRVRRIITRARRGTAPQDLVDEARAVVLAWYVAAKAKLDAAEERMKVWV